MAASAQALDRYFIADAGDYDLPGASLGGAMHGEQIAVEDAHIAHAHPAHSEQIVGAGSEPRGIDLAVALDMLLSKDRTARRYPADERQADGFLKANATRGTGQEFDRPLARQGSEMILSAAGRCEAQGLGDLGTRGRR